MPANEQSTAKISMRTVYATVGLAGWLLLAAASMRFDVIAIEPESGHPFTVRRIVWPWQSDEPHFDLQQEGSYTLNRYGFFGLYGQGCERYGGLHNLKSYSGENH
jgi:hypothetical protein